jgi:hypothetical protein
MMLSIVIDASATLVATTTCRSIIHPSINQYIPTLLFECHVAQAQMPVVALPLSEKISKFPSTFCDNTRGAVIYRSDWRATASLTTTVPMSLDSLPL